MRVPFWTRLLLLAAAAKLAGTLLALLAAVRLLGGYRSCVSAWVDIAVILTFGGVAGFLIVNRGEDRRAVALGGFFLAVGSAFCWRPLQFLSTAEPIPSGLQDFAGFLHAFKLDCFVPYFFWAFVRDFPAVPVSARLRRTIALGLRASALLGVGLLVANLLQPVLAGPFPPLGSFLSWFEPQVGKGIYYLVVALLTAPAVATLVAKARSAQGEEWRRVRLFTAALVVGVLPPLLEMLGEVCFESYRDRVLSSPRLGTMVLVLCLFLLTIPFTTAYAVTVHHVLNLRLVARRAIQWALARYTAVVLVAVPFAGIWGYLYGHRTRPLAELFSGPGMLLMLATMGAGLAALRYRRPLLEEIDRHFFREQFDARRTLTQLVERIRGTNDSIELANEIAGGVDRALHVDSVALLVEDPRTGIFADPHPRSRARKLDASSQLARMIADASDPLEVDLGKPASPLATLPEPDRHWLVDSAFRLLVPILASGGELLGVIGLGEKKSGLPFLREDRRLLADIARTAALGLELRKSRLAVVPLGSGEKAPTVDNAKECLHCGFVFVSHMVFCGTCSRRLDPALVPYVLPGKFRFEKRIGAGGMGVVYGGSDLSLGRPVAVKTLRRVSPEDAIRLRREARAAAAVSHRHLAAIFGVETWRGTPMLILEFLEGGTLAGRIERERMAAREVVNLGIAMAEALARLHAADILHRDIKPSNIGYSRDGTPKLMDFGIARTRNDSRPEGALGSSASAEEGDSSLLPPTSIWDPSPNALTPTRQLVGTLSYLSPEVLSGQRAEASSDLWSLCIVLLECLLRRKVFADDDPKQLIARIQLARVPDLEQACPGSDPALAEFFRQALHRSPARRPKTADELKSRLEEVRGRLAASPDPRPREDAPDSEGGSGGRSAGGSTRWARLRGRWGVWLKTRLLGPAQS